MGSQKMFQALSHCKSLFPIQTLLNVISLILKGHSLRDFNHTILNNMTSIFFLPKLTYSSNAQEKASVAEIIFRRFELSGPLKCGQFLTNGTSIWQCITWKILQRKSDEICIKNDSITYIYIIRKKGNSLCNQLVSNKKQ